MSMTKIIRGSTIVNTMRRAQPAPGQKFGDHIFERVDIELTIDIDKILRHLGHKAGTNRTGRATLLAGAVKAKVTKRSPT
jgi:hypothetical protein